MEGANRGKMGCLRVRPSRSAGSREWRDQGSRVRWMVCTARPHSSWHVAGIGFFAGEMKVTGPTIGCHVNFALCVRSRKEKVNLSGFERLLPATTTLAWADATNTMPSTTSHLRQEPHKDTMFIVCEGLLRCFRLWSSRLVFGSAETGL